jgi:hypothetical protein
MKIKLMGKYEAKMFPEERVGLQVRRLIWIISRIIPFRHRDRHTTTPSME